MWGKMLGCRLGDSLSNMFKGRIMGLTKLKIEKLAKRGMYRDDRTLYMSVSPRGSKSWIQRLVIKGRRRDLGLGPWPRVSIEEAREKAFDNRRKVYKGESILKEKKEEIPTFSELLEEVIKINRPTWKDGGKTEKHWRACLEAHAKGILHKQVDEITSNDVLGIGEKLWTTKHEMSQKVKRRIGAVLSRAVLKKYRPDNPVESVNGANLPKSTKLKGHFKTIPYDQVGAAIQTIQAGTAFISTKLAFEFLILTATRSQEVRKANWSEIDMEKRQWNLPGPRTKTGESLCIPLSSRAPAILHEAKEHFGDTGLIFPAKRGGVMSDATISKAVKDNGIQGVPHAISRACFKTWAEEKGIARAVSEASLGQKLQGLDAAYLRSDLLEQRKEVMQRWSDYLQGKGLAKVVNLH